MGETDVKNITEDEDSIGFCFYCLLGLPCEFAAAEKAAAEEAKEKEENSGQ